MGKTYRLIARDANGGVIEEHGKESMTAFAEALVRALRDDTLAPGETYTIQVVEEVDNG